MSVGSRLRKVMLSPPRRFQVRGVRFVEERRGRALIGDEMGVGKTFQAIGWTAIHPDKRPVIVICPASLKYNWQRELMVHAGYSSTVLEGKTPRSLKGESIVIINYEVLKAWKQKLLQMRAKILIVDEVHFIKSRGVQRTRAVKSLAAKIPHLIALSGTPIVNRPVEFFPILNMIAPKIFSEFLTYAFRYCDPRRGWRGRGWNFSGASNIQKLHKRVSHLMIRRTKDDVLPDLPQKVRTYIPVRISMQEYHRAENDFLHWYKTKKGDEAMRRAAKAETIVRLGVLKCLAAEGVLPSAFDWIDNFLEESGQKLIVFYVHRVIADALLGRYPGAAHIGSEVTDSKARQEQADRFQQDPKCRLLIGGIKPAGTGWTLTAASTTLFTEVGWTPGEHDQAEDRVHRIGQTAQSVNAYYLIPKDTIVEETVALVEEKRKIISQIVDGKEPEQTMDIVDSLVKSIRRKHAAR